MALLSSLKPSCLKSCSGLHFTWTTFPFFLNSLGHLVAKCQSVSEEHASVNFLWYSFCFTFFSSSVWVEGCKYNWRWFYVSYVQLFNTSCNIFIHKISRKASLTWPHSGGQGQAMAVVNEDRLQQRWARTDYTAVGEGRLCSGEWWQVVQMGPRCFSFLKI